MHLVEKEDIVLINLVANSESETEKIALYIGRCGANKYAETKSDETRARKEAYFARSQGHVMNAKTKSVNYSRITFATLESHREASLSSPVRSFYLMRSQSTLQSSFFAHIYFQNVPTPCTLFFCLSHCATTLELSTNPPTVP